MVKEESQGPEEGSKGGRPRSMQAQQAILDATLALLAEEGFDAMSMEAIAARAGVGKKTIYRWWSSKDALVIDAIKNLQQTHNPVVDSGSLRDDLIALFRNTFQTWSGAYAKGMAANLLGVMTTHPEVYQAFYEQAFAPRIQRFAQALERAQVRGEIRQDLDADEVVGLLAGPIWYHMFFDMSNKALTPGLAERIVNVIFEGIAK
jgi:AcrR family transcriptional regulator